MGLGQQKSSATTLLHYLRWADAAGIRVGEHPNYGGVRPVHTPGSWHYDGLAADLNHGPPGASAGERRMLLYALDVASSMGLGAIFARDGTSGSAATHRDHLHVDCGPTSNFGKGRVPVRPGDRRVQRLQAAVHFEPRLCDNLWGPKTDRRLEAVRRASRMHGNSFPEGIEFAQRSVGAKRTGTWDAASRAAHDATVARIQRALGVPAGGAWNPATEKAFLALRARRRR